MALERSSKYSAGCLWTPGEPAIAIIAFAAKNHGLAQKSQLPPRRGEGKWGGAAFRRGREDHRYSPFSCAEKNRSPARPGGGDWPGAFHSHRSRQKPGSRLAGMLAKWRSAPWDATPPRPSTCEIQSVIVEKSRWRQEARAESPAQVVRRRRTSHCGAAVGRCSDRLHAIFVLPAHPNLQLTTGNVDDAAAFSRVRLPSRG